MTPPPAQDLSRQRPILILGAGINGAAVAREFVLRGASVVIVDTGDLASGTTAYSSRLIHGGLRYLEYGEFDLVRESLTERDLLLRLAPQFVQPLRLFIPVAERWSGWWRAVASYVKGSSGSDSQRGLWLVRAGLTLYDRYAKESQLPHHAVHRTDDACAPPVDRNAFRWLCSYWDAQIVYPERFVVALLEDARRLAVERNLTLDVRPYHRVELHAGIARLYRPGSDSAERDEPPIGDPVQEFRPAAVVNATGAWVDHTLARLRVSSPRLIGGTKGSHFLTFSSKLRASLASGGIYAEAHDGRPVFVLPYGEGTLVGTTDLPFASDPASAVATEEELNYLVAAVNRVLPSVALSRDDVHVHYSGVRPLPFVDAATPAAITRRHWLQSHEQHSPPIFSVIGGKLTTCRSLAEQTAINVLTRLDWQTAGSSRDRVLPGGEDYPTDEPSLAAVQRRLATSLGLTPAAVRSAWNLWGTRVGSLLPSEATTSPEQKSLPLPSAPLPLCFVRRVVTDEWVTHLSDLVERRLMLHFRPDLNVQCLRELAELMVEAGRIAPSQIEPEVAACTTRLENHFGWQRRASVPLGSLTTNTL